MKPSYSFKQHRAAIRQIIRRHHADNARIFGSVLKGTDKEGSDLDIIVDPTPSTTLMDIGAMRLELRNLLGVDVDILTPKSLPDHYREQVLRDAQPV